MSIETVDRDVRGTVVDSLLSIHFHIGPTV